MYFATLTDFFYMDGHGVYVWSVYIVAVIILATLVVTPMLDKRRFLREEAQRIRRDQAGKRQGEREPGLAHRSSQQQLSSSGG